MQQRQRTVEQGHEWRRRVIESEAEVVRIMATSQQVEVAEVLTHVLKARGIEEQRLAPEHPVDHHRPEHGCGDADDDQRDGAALRPRITR